jgi:hypothetical protein
LLARSLTQMGAAISVTLLALMVGCSSEKRSVPQPVPSSLVAGVGEEIVDGQGSVPCETADQQYRPEAEQRALYDAVRRAAAAHGGSADRLLIDEVIVTYRTERFWQEQGQCLARVQAVVRTALLQRTAREETREELRALGRPMVAFAIASYRILPNTAVTTRRAAAEIIDSLQQELITRGFDVRRSIGARREALSEGGTEVLDISSAERDRIASAALRDGVRFLVQGEIKVTDEGKQDDGQYLAVVDGSVEAIELATDRVVGSFRDVATAKHMSASAAYTKAISAFARSAAAELAPQMLDTWQHSDFRWSEIAATP